MIFIFHGKLLTSKKKGKYILSLKIRSTYCIILDYYKLCCAHRAPG